MANYRIIQVAGNGHSGSTLLSIYAGTAEKVFNAGEITNITRKTIREEYCSCGERIGDCPLWTRVYEYWETHSPISEQEYHRLRLFFERNKVIVRTCWNELFPSGEYKLYKQSVKVFFDGIAHYTNAETIIDASKSPARTLILSGLAELKVIHICRSFTGVLNSSKRSSKKDIKAGIEQDNPARRTGKVLLDWLLNNWLCEWINLTRNSRRLKYRTFIANPLVIKGLDPAFQELDINKPFAADHMLAGNVIRLKKQIVFQPKIGQTTERLNKLQVFFAKGIDKLFFFWS